MNITAQSTLSSVGRDRAVRQSGAFGPLQALAGGRDPGDHAVAKDDRTVMQMIYRVSGNADAALDKLAAPVDVS